MTDPITIYKSFNYVEGAIWFLVALGLPIFIKPTTTQKKLAIGIASVGFIAFGTSDFLEAAHQGEITIGLLAFKIFCGAVILCGRFTYIGWKEFKLTDRYFLFGLFCLIAVLGIIAVKMYFGKIHVDNSEQRFSPMPRLE
ncbi:MAG: hypothetical protein V4727_05205 [Verrucomicrobiota bacterium]